MSRVISIHEYVLKPDADERAFVFAIYKAQADGILQLPGLVAYHFLRGIKGVRQGGYTALWIYESREAWERLWGTSEHPRPKEEYPENWKIWEQEILAPFLIQDPDQITFTAYEEL